MVNPRIKVKASSLIETIVAIVIITMVSGIFFMIIINLTKNTNLSLKTQSIIEVNNQINHIKQHHDFSDRLIEYANLKLIITFDDTEYSESLKELTITATDLNDNEIYTINHYIYTR